MFEDVLVTQDKQHLELIEAEANTRRKIMIQAQWKSYLKRVPKEQYIKDILLGHEVALFVRRHKLK